MDLLNPSSHKDLNMREGVDQGVYIENLIEETVIDVTDMMNLTTRGA